VSDAIVRPTRSDDIEQVIRVQMAAFEQPLEQLSEERLAKAHRRHLHFIEHDPDGTFVATIDDRIVGHGAALVREGLWGLSLLVVDPTTQSHGIGNQLLDATLRCAEGCDRAIIQSGSDPRGIRAYGTRGFDLFPQMMATGKPVVDSATGSVARVRDGEPTDHDLANEIDRAVRGAGRGPDHDFIAPGMDMYVVDDADGRGYAYRRDSDVYLLAATDDATAQGLLWHCLIRIAELDIEAAVDHLTAEQQWAIEACFVARLKVVPGGPVFWRGATPPRSYLPSGAFL
jgi:predicted N-acetyltransferase YhbS